jgi:RHS repeat-associated protein
MKIRTGLRFNDSVIISGTQFGLTQGTSTAKFNTSTATVTSWSSNTIVATVPGGLTGSVTVTVTVLGNPSNGVTYTVDATPSISGLSTNSGPVGTPVTVSGSNFGSTQGTSTVTFNGIPATVTGSNWSSGSISTTVPNGATTGNVVVTVQGVTSTGNPTFTVTGSDPVISSLSVPSEPVSGSSSVTITGSNFTSTQGSVTVGGNPATVTSWGNTSIVATLPSGAITGSLVYVTVSSVNSNSVPLALDSVYYYFSDSLGTTRLVTDSNGTICYDSDYLPYGREQNYTNTCSQTYKFTGYERDAETNNDYAVARHYNSRIFRFLQPDPAGMSSAILTNPQSWNRYAYVGNNPSNVTDPSGMDPGDDGWDPGGWDSGGWSGGGGGCDYFGCPGGGISEQQAQQGIAQAQAGEYWGGTYGDRPGEGSEDPSSSAPSVQPAGAASSCPPEKQRFFDWLSEPLGRMGDDLNVPEPLLLTEAAKEGGWTTKDLNHNQPLNNPFGVNSICKGGAACGNVGYDSLDAAINDWESKFGDRVQGVDTPDDFAYGLQHPDRGQPYNSADPNYENKYQDLYPDVQKWMGRCNVQ